MQNAMTTGSKDGLFKRAPRLVTMSVGFRLEGYRGVRLEGHSTGLNENGMAGRVNIIHGSLPPDPAGLVLSVTLDLPKDRPFRSIRGEILHVSPSWVPGFKHFLAVRFLEIMPEDISFLRRFIAWREADYFKADKPVRQWYIFSAHEQQVFGPLTAEEVRKAVGVNGIMPQDHVWYPLLNRWMPVHAPELDAEFSWIGEEITKHLRSFGHAAPSVARFRPFVVGVEEARPLAPLPPVSEIRNEPAPVPPSPATVRKRKIASFLTTLVLLGLAAASSAAFWHGELDFTPAGQLFRQAREQLGRKESYPALLTFDRLRRQYPDHRLAARGGELMRQILAEDLLARDRQIARARLELLDKLPESSQRLPVVLTARGDALYRSGDLPGAIEAFRQAVQHTPNDGVYRYNLGTAYLRNRDYRLAQEYLARPVPPMGRSASYYLNSGLAFLALQQNDDARERFEAALQLSESRKSTDETIRLALARPDR